MGKALLLVDLISSFSTGCFAAQAHEFLICGPDIEVGRHRWGPSIRDQRPRLPAALFADYNLLGPTRFRRGTFQGLRFWGKSGAHSG